MKKVACFCLFFTSANHQTVSEDSTAIIWELKSLTAASRFKGHKESVHAVCMHAAQRLVFSGDRSGQILVCFSIAAARRIFFCNERLPSNGCFAGMGPRHG